MYNINCVMQSKIHFQAITRLQLHINPSHLFSFYNTFLVESVKKFARGIIFDIVEHDHPLNKIGKLPFVIVNDTHIISQGQLLKLIQSISSTTPLKSLLLNPIFQLCEQISSVAIIKSEKAKNPYYLLLSPLKKYQVYNWNHNFSKDVRERTQYFYPDTQDLNHDYFIYRIDTLADLMKTVERDHLKILCVYAMIKALRLNNKILYETVSKNEVFTNLQEQGLKVIAQIDVRHPNQEIRSIGILKERKGRQQEEKDIQIKDPYKVPSRLDIFTRILLPIIGIGLAWKLQKMIGKQN